MLRFKQNLCLLWFLWCLLHCNAKKPLKSSMKNGYFHELYDDNYAESFNSMNNLFVNNVYTNLKLPEIKTSCANDILNIILGIYQKQSWALQWLDATAHPPPGILGGAMHWVGSYDVCLKCSGYHSIGEKEEPKFHGSYCTMVFDMNTSIAIIPELRMSVGLCMPNTCTSEEVRSIINTTAYYLLLRLNQKESFCHRFVGDVQKDTWYYIAVSICSALTILVVIATSIDMFLYIQWYHVQNLNKYITGTNHISERSSIENVNHIEEQTHPLIESDGIVNNDQERENVRKIDEKHLTTFNEYRKSVLEKRILTKILCAYSLPINTMKLCAQRMEDDKSSRTYNISLTFLDGIRCMSMIWIIGGHILLHGYKLTNNLMILAGEFRRIWLFGMYFNGHLAPDIFFFMSLWDYKSWRFSIFIQGFINVLSMYGTINKFNWCEKPYEILVNVNRTSFYQSFYIYFQLNHLIINSIAKDEIYVRPYTRCGAYMIGMLTGWLLYEYPRLEMRNTRRNQFFIVSIGYLVAAFLFVLPIFISYGVLSGLLTEMSRKTAAAYLAFHRVSFTLGIGISVYLCAIGWGKPIYNTFAWSGFRVPARLTYSAYLIHPIIVTIFINGAQTPFIIDQLEVVRLTASTTVFSYIVAYILSMTTEYPISTLEKYLFR
ncbi:hypothetical protein Smp_162060 [Schistosoma mansoni]|uniref:hypothetical protein n=1 Tax=Schistosoma mansoni TaxID=6183 RepID=UPI0001A6238E|nr:hypothetical protein Smp_162060 [Schistosoma mansoni]|eukprot:XP_018647721.1 hypothetical protein Smp_162060 [Schistosoma mansoni]